MSHCCNKMSIQVKADCIQHPKNCPDEQIIYIAKFREYGLKRPGAQSFDLIHFCPWCGSELPHSLRERWFNELEQQGFSPHLTKDIPLQYHNDLWWKPEGQ
jgi:hypothetical protein